MSVVDDESGRNYDLMEAMDNKELLSYIDEKTLFVYNLKDHKKQKIYKSRDGILNEKYIRKYYWFNDQKKFFIFERRNNKLIGNIIFNEKNIIIEYKCF